MGPVHPGGAVPGPVPAGALTWAKSASDRPYEYFRNHLAFVRLSRRPFQQHSHRYLLSNEQRNPLRSFAQGEADQKGIS